MAIFSRESLETLKQKIDLLEVLTNHIELKRAGGAYKGLCPFHDEKTPSFTIQRGDSHYHCFGCGAHGDAIQFLMEYLNMTFFEAIENLADKFNVHMEKVESRKGDKGVDRKRMKEAMDLAARFYHFYLLHTEEGHRALEYLYKRGLDLDFIREFCLGFSPKQPGMFRKIMNSSKVSNEILEAVGLITTRQNGGWRDFFFDRIMFPVNDASGNVIGFSARKYKEETFGGKYINSSETPLFKKSKVLYGIHYCRRRIAKERKALIVEGQVDALRLIHAGLGFTVAGQGTAFGEGQVRELLNLGVSEIYLGMDADTAGREATKKVGHLFQKVGVEVYVLDIPVGMDPDAMLIEKGPEAFLELLNEAQDYLSFLVNYVSGQYNLNSPAGKSECVHHLSKSIRDWDNPLMVHESLRKLARLMNVPENVIGIGQNLTPNVYMRKTGVMGHVTVDPHVILESDLLRWLLLLGKDCPQYVDLVQTNLSKEDFKAPICRRVYEIYCQAYQNEKSLDLISLAMDLNDEEGQRFISEILQKKINKERADEHLMNTVQKMLNRNWMHQCEDIKMKMHSGQCSDEEALALAKEFDELRRKTPQLV